VDMRRIEGASDPWLPAVNRVGTPIRDADSISSHTISTSTICRCDGAGRKKLDWVHTSPFPSPPPGHDPSNEKMCCNLNLLIPKRCQGW
jgi:hypothetical protein